jgi:hypothetical protein
MLVAEDPVTVSARRSYDVFKAADALACLAERELAQAVLEYSSGRGPAPSHFLRDKARMNRARALRALNELCADSSQESAQKF